MLHNWVEGPNDMHASEHSHNGDAISGAVDATLAGSDQLDATERIVYLDHAATTPVRPEVLEAMLPYFGEMFGNPSSLYALAGESRNGIDWARRTIAAILNCRPSELVFTGGGTEADNLAIKGAVSALPGEPHEVIVGAAEHHAVIHAAEQLESRGHTVRYAAPDEFGIVHPDAVTALISERTALVSVMYVNNELGAISDVAAITDAVKQRAAALGTDVLVHTDAVQAAGKMPCDVKALGVDLLTLAAHKIHGPKGVGALYVRRGVEIEPLIAGGGQERQRRSGTENVPGIVGLGKALELAEAERDTFCERTRELRDRFVAGIADAIPDVVVNHHPAQSVPHIAHVSLPGLEGEPMLLGLDFQGVCASSGSACSSASIEPSHVLVATGMDLERAAGSLRFSLGKDTTDADITHAISALSSVVAQLRTMASADYAAA